MSASSTNSSWLLCLLFLPLFSSADEVVLTARPGLCILKDPESQACVMGVQLDWSGPVGDYCLYDSTASAPLACWQQREGASHAAELASRDDVAYWLERGASDERLAEVSVRVLSLAQRRPERRRRRHAWTPL